MPVPLFEHDHLDPVSIATIVIDKGYRNPISGSIYVSGHGFRTGPESITSSSRSSGLGQVALFPEARGLLWPDLVRRSEGVHFLLVQCDDDSHSFLRNARGMLSISKFLPPASITTRAFGSRDHFTATTRHWNPANGPSSTSTTLPS